MARNTGIYFEGLRETTRNLEQLGVDVADMKDVMASIAAKAVDVMRPFIPSVSGTLRASARGNRAKGKAVVTVGSARVKYAQPINWGWPRRHISPAHFTQKTDQAMDDTAVRMLTDGIDRLIRERGFDGSR